MKKYIEKLLKFIFIYKNIYKNYIKDHKLYKKVLI